jgi:antitoxin component YwqK of YwqJK toxin-antitoxin module
MEIERVIIKEYYRDMAHEIHYHDYDCDFHHYEFTRINGEIDGTFYVYYPNGQRRWKLTYKKGVQEGPQVAWHVNGSLYMKFNKKDGHIIGDFYTYAPNGQLISKDCTGPDGMYCGTAYYWRLNGQLEYTATYSYTDGQRIAHTKHYYKNGKILSDSYFNCTTHQSKTREWDVNGVLVVDI